MGLVALSPAKAKKAAKRWAKRDAQNAIAVQPMHADDFREKRLIEQRRAAGLL